MVEDEQIFQAQNLIDTDAEGFVAITKKENKGLLEGMEAVTQAYLDALDQKQTTSETTAQ